MCSSCSTRLGSLRAIRSARPSALTLRVLLDEHAVDRRPAPPGGLGVVHHVKSLIGVTCEVAVKAPGEVPRSEGKALRVRDLRKRG
jgi:phenylacetate-coenzyme A ligase PaaK-like adenylate-forming protein